MWARSLDAVELDFAVPSVGKRRWDDAVQAAASDSMDEPRQVVAQNREAWQSLDTAFIARVTLVAHSRAEAMPNDVICLQSQVHPNYRNEWA